MGILKAVAIIAAAILIGRWFLDELKKNRAAEGPWYKPYISLPGIIIILAILLPVILRFFDKL